jgi:hypothetical protein
MKGAMQTRQRSGRAAIRPAEQASNQRVRQLQLSASVIFSVRFEVRVARLILWYPRVVADAN